MATLVISSQLLIVQVKVVKTLNADCRKKYSTNQCETNSSNTAKLEVLWEVSFICNVLVPEAPSRMNLEKALYAIGRVVSMI